MKKVEITKLNNWIDKKVKQLLCSHPYWKFVRNIYGDEINYTNARSIYKCEKCGKYKFSQTLHAE